MFCIAAAFVGAASYCPGHRSGRGLERRRFGRRRPEIGDCRPQIAVHIAGAPPRTAGAWPNVAIVSAEYRCSW